MSDGRGRTALVTGASAGIGAALARVFARNGFDLVITARRGERLQGLKNELESACRVRVATVTADLAREDACERLVSEAGAFASIDVLVNNAGYGLPGLYGETPWSAQRDFLQVMVVAPCELVHRLLPGMLARGYGRIVNVASVAGLMPGAASATLYGASKAHMIAFSEALHGETLGRGVNVTALCPGFTLTEFHDVNGTRLMMNRLPRFIWLDAEKVALAGYRAVMRNDPICVPGALYKVLTTAVRVVPRRLALRSARRSARFRGAVKPLP